MESVPKEVLDIIFSFIYFYPYYFRLSRVCKEWMIRSRRDQCCILAIKRQLTRGEYILQTNLFGLLSEHFKNELRNDLKYVTE